MKAFVVAAVLGLLGAASAQRMPAHSAPPSFPFTVTGVVVNSTTGEPIAGANLSLALSPIETSMGRPMRMGTPAAASRFTTSARDGSFTFPGVPAGSYILSGVARGFAQQMYEQHDQFTCGIVVGEGNDSSGIRFALEPDASLSGTILDDYNDPVPNAQVMLFREGMANGNRGIYRAQVAGTRDDGHYHFAHLRPGHFYVAVSAVPWYAQYGRGFRRAIGSDSNAALDSDPNASAVNMAFPITFYPSVTDESAAEVIDIHPGDRATADVTLTAVPAFRIRIHTTPLQGDNIFPSLIEIVFGTADNAVGGHAFTSRRGGVDMLGVAPGHYRLEFRATGPNRRAAAVGEQEVDVTGDTDIHVDDFPSGVAISGRVRFDSAPPDRDVHLSLAPDRGIPVELHVDAKGRISSDQPLMPGKYELSLPVFGYQITQISAEGASVSGQSLRVGSNDVVLSLVAGKTSGHIAGFVRKDDRPFPGAMVVLIPQDLARPTLYRRDESNSDGSFELSTVPAGTYTLVAIENGWDLEWANPAVMKPYIAAGTPVQVTTGGRYTIDPKIQQAGAP